MEFIEVQPVKLHKISILIRSWNYVKMKIHCFVMAHFLENSVALKSYSIKCNRAYIKSMELNFFWPVYKVYSSNNLQLTPVTLKLLELPSIIINLFLRGTLTVTQIYE